MKIFDMTERDRQLDRLRVEFSGHDLDLLEGVYDRLCVLLKIEDAMESMAVPSPSFFGTGVPWPTADGIKLLGELCAIDEPMMEVG